MLGNANTIEAEHYINTQAIDGSPITPAEIQSHALLTPDEIALRAAAIKALADYTCALATLASGKNEAQVQTDFSTASASLKTLADDSASALTHSTSTAYGGPVSAAVAAMGNVIQLVLRHRNMAAVRRSIFENDASLNKLYDLIAKESQNLYAREKSNVGSTGVGIQMGYDKVRLAPSPNSADLLQMADRYKQWQRDSAAVAGADPSASIAAFKKCHDKLIETILATNSLKKESLAELIADVKAFAADVTPLATSLQALASSL